MEPTDPALLARWHTGDRTAYETLFRRHYPAVHRALVQMLGSDGADDVAQETLLTLYQQPPTVTPTVNVAAWLYRVALNRGYNALRGERRAVARAAAALPPTPGEEPPDAAIRSEERAAVRAVLAQLPQRQRELLVLRSSGASYADIAEVLGVAPGSVGTLLARAERAFLRLYDDETGSVDESAVVGVRTR